MRKLQKAFMIVVCAMIFAIPSCRYVIPTFGDYSDGERSGTLQKFSKKGMLFKTYEGELATEGMTIKTGKNGGGSSVFAFSVTDEKVATQLDTMIDKNVILKYHQVFHSNAKDGDTEYFITSVAIPKTELK